MLQSLDGPGRDARAPGLLRPDQAEEGPAKTQQFSWRRTHLPGQGGRECVESQ